MGTVKFTRFEIHFNAWTNTFRAKNLNVRVKMILKAGKFQRTQVSTPSLLLQESQLFIDKIIMISADIGLN